MILFRPEHVKPILEGIKIKTRRIGKRRWNPDSIHRSKTKMLSSEYFALLRILTVHQEPLGAMTEKDAWDEGGYTLEGYKDVWRRINGKDSWDSDRVVWVVQFERVFNRLEICRKCYQYDPRFICRPKNCCVIHLFDTPEKFSNNREITDFCCRQRCHHDEDYHEKACPIKLSGAGNQYYHNPRTYKEKDKSGRTIMKLWDYFEY